MRGKHLVFYDGTCGLCDHIVQWILKHDPQHLFDFAPLQGETAQKLVPPALMQEDTLVLITDYQTHPRTYILAQGAFRIAWLLGGLYAIPGVLSFLPPFLFNWGYRLVARNRRSLFPGTCTLPTLETKDRFLN